VVNRTHLPLVVVQPRMAVVALFLSLTSKSRPLRPLLERLLAPLRPLLERLLAPLRPLLERLLAPLRPLLERLLAPLHPLRSRLLAPLPSRLLELLSGPRQGCCLRDDTRDDPAHVFPKE
jgi:hypothetical protein